jgi:hypothetical protein
MRSRTIFIRLKNGNEFFVNTMPDPNIKILIKESYLKAIENSVGTHIFNSLIVQYQDSGKTVDILQDGVFSCAFFVSSILVLSGLMDKPHTTVKTLKEKLEENKWQIVIGDAQPGDVIFWEKIKFEDGSENEHVGFATSDIEAISTSWTEHKVVHHSIALPTYEGSKPPRKITASYRNFSFSQ